MRQTENTAVLSAAALKKLLRKRGILILLIIIAVFFTLQVIGNPWLMPFTWGVRLDAPSVAYFGEDASVIVDQSGCRLLFLDKNEQLRRVEVLDSSSQLDYITGVTEASGSFYLWGYKLQKNSGYTKYDSILRYDQRGKYLETVYTADRTERNVERCLILDADIDGDALWLTEISGDPRNYWNCGLSVFSVDLSAPEQTSGEVFLQDWSWECSANYLPQDKVLYASTNFGQLYRISQGENTSALFAKTQYARTLLPLDVDTVIWCESDTRDLYLNDELLLQDTDFYNNLSVDKDGFAYDDENNSCLHRVSLTTGETAVLETVQFSPVFGIMTVLRFLSPVFLAGLLLFWFIRRSVLARKQKTGSASQKIAMLLALFLIAGLISVFYTVQVVKTHEESRDNEITVMSRYFAETVDTGMLEDAVFRKDFLYDGEAYERWQNAWGYLSYHYGSFRDRADETAKTAYVSFYQKVGNDYLCVFDSWAVNPIGSKLVGSSASDSTRSEDIQVFSRASESIIYKVTPILNGNGETQGLLLLGMDYQLTKAQIFSKCLDMTLTLTVLFVTAFLLFTEGKKLVEGLRKKKERQAQGDKNSELALIRPLFFLFNLTSSFDGVILVLVAKDMLAGADISEAARLTLMAVPALVAGIGSIIGLPICSLLSGRIPVRKLTVSACVICALAFVGMSLSVHFNIFALFCALKLGSSLVNSVLYGIFSAIPMRAGDEKTRYDAVNESEMGRISSTILGPLLGGVVAQVFSNEAIYLLNAVSFLPVIALLLAAMPKQTLYSVRKKSLAGGKQLVRYVFSLPTLSYLFLLVIPAMTIGGYKSYLFPIYLSAMELPPIYITFFYVLALSVAMLMITPLTNALRASDHWNRAVLFLALIGIAFLGFFINTTFWWAIIMLVINTVLEKLLKVSMTMLWPRQAASFGLELVPTSNVMNIFDQGAYALKETVLSMFLMLGNSFACVAVGGFCLVCAALFSALTARSPMAKADASE